MIRNTLHKGIVLDVSERGFDSGGATFATVFYDEEVSDKFFMFYSGASDKKWSKSSIGLALSSNGLSFTKFNRPVIDPEDFNYKEAVTPVVFRVRNRLYMVFAGRPSGKGRRLCLAYSDDPKGPWHFTKVLIRPEYLWEGGSVDLGPSVVKFDDEVLLYYSNVSNKFFERLFKPQYWLTKIFWLRRIGILKLRIRTVSDIEIYRFEGNPLQHLNGSKGSWNESLFCPGYFKFRNKHYLLPAASTYFIGFPYKQYIGLIEDTTPYFLNPTKMSILINGPEEKGNIYPGIKGEIALDAPCPIIRDGELWLYYAVMDRANGIWKTALSIYTFGGE